MDRSSDSLVHVLRVDTALRTAVKLKLPRSGEEHVEGVSFAMALRICRAACYPSSRVFAFLLFLEPHGENPHEVR
jgi:hypothetical protein